MALNALQQFRRPRQRWLALWAVLGMLLNQIALADHLCREVRGLQGAHTHQASDSLSASMRCHASPESTGTVLPDPGQIACSTHCDDADKQVRDKVVLNFPALTGVGPELAVLRHDRSMGSIASDPRTADSVRDRHGRVYRVLLI